MSNQIFNHHRKSWTWHIQPSSQPSEEFHIAGQRPTIVFVHQFGGGRHTLNRSLKLVNRLGLDAAWFPLLYNEVVLHALPPATSNGWGFGRVWTNQVAHVLKNIRGPKVLFTHSMPSNSAMVALAENPNEVHGWICDGGPFLKIFECVNNLYRKHFHMHAPAAFAMTAASLVWYGKEFQRSLPQKLKTLPSGFPILSLRGEKDPLVLPSAIDEFFSHNPNLNLTTKSFAEGGHLDLLKRFESEYEESVREFLKAVIR